MINISPKLLAVAKKIKLLILDVDGVLTDGTLQYTKDGEKIKNFNAKDGLGIRMLQESGVEVAVITARKSPAVEKRMNDLKINHFYTGYDNKIEAFNDLLKNLSIHPDSIAYAGDDVLDIPVMRLVALPVTVADAHFFAKQHSKWITSANGGHGAVREIADALIASKQDINNFYDDFLVNHIGKTKMDKL